MRRLASTLVALTIILSLCSCGGKAQATYQEQYDLGAKYLSEGNYEQAVIAFTAAIEIEDYHAEAYIGRGDAYVQLAGSDAATADEKYESAIADYKQSIELDGGDAEVYLKLADLYTAQGDAERATEILRQGFEATGDERLNKKPTEEPGAGNGNSETVTVDGTLIYNPDAYSDTWNAYIGQYEDDDASIRASIDTYGVRFSAPVTVTIDGQAITLSEACFLYEENLFDAGTELFNYNSQKVGTRIGVKLRMTGYFYKNDQATELEGPVVHPEEEDCTYYNYRPNGDYCFYLTGYELIS